MYTYFIPEQTQCGQHILSFVVIEYDSLYIVEMLS